MAISCEGVVAPLALEASRQHRRAALLRAMVLPRALSLAPRDRRPPARRPGAAASCERAPRQLLGSGPAAPAPVNVNGKRVSARHCARW